MCIGPEVLEAMGEQTYSGASAYLGLDATEPTQNFDHDPAYMSADGVSGRLKEWINRRWPFQQIKKMRDDWARGRAEKFIEPLVIKALDGDREALAFLVGLAEHRAPGAISGIKKVAENDNEWALLALGYFAAQGEREAEVALFEFVKSERPLALKHFLIASSCRFELLMNFLNFFESLSEKKQNQFLQWIDEDTTADLFQRFAEETAVRGVVVALAILAHEGAMEFLNSKFDDLSLEQLRMISLYLNDLPMHHLIRAAGRGSYNALALLERLRGLGNVEARVFMENRLKTVSH